MLALVFYDVEAIRERKIVSNVHDLIKELPSVVSLDGNSLDLVGATSTTICISGEISHLDMDQLSGFLKSLPADEVEAIEVIYNAPPRWHVKGSVINVVMKRKRNYSMNGQAQGSWTNQHRNSFDAGGTLITSTPEWDFDFMYKYDYVGNRNEQENEDLLNDGGNDYRKVSDIDEHTATAYAGFHKSFWDGRLSVGASLTGELYKIGGYRKNALLPNAELAFVPSGEHIFQASYNTLRTYPSYWQRQDFTSYSDEYAVYMGNPLLKPARTSNLNFTSILPVGFGEWFASSLVLTAYNEKYKSNDWYGYRYDRSKWTGMAAADNTFTLLREPRLSVNLMLFYRSPSIQGIWDLDGNWGVNAGIRYSFWKGNAIVGLQCNDMFETMYPDIKVRFETQNQDMDQNAFNRSFTVRFTYKFKGYKERQREEVDTSARRTPAPPRGCGTAGSFRTAASSPSGRSPILTNISSMAITPARGASGRRT